MDRIYDKWSKRRLCSCRQAIFAFILLKHRIVYECVIYVLCINSPPTTGLYKIPDSPYFWKLRILWFVIQSFTFRAKRTFTIRIFSVGYDFCNGIILVNKNANGQRVIRKYNGEFLGFCKKWNSHMGVYFYF